MLGVGFFLLQKVTEPRLCLSFLFSPVSYHNYQLIPSFDGNGQTNKLIKNAKRDRKGPELKNCALSINVATINNLLRIQTDPDFEQLINQQK